MAEKEFLGASRMEWIQLNYKREAAIWPASDQKVSSETVSQLKKEHKNLSESSTELYQPHHRLKKNGREWKGTSDRH